MKYKKALSVVIALVIMLTIIIMGLWLMRAFWIFGLVVGGLALAGVVYLSALMVEWLTKEDESLEPIAILADELEESEAE